MSHLLWMLVSAVLWSKVTNADFVSSFSFKVENCTNNAYFPDENSSPSSSTFLGAFVGQNTDCLGGQVYLSGYQNASNGVMLKRPQSELDSTFAVSDILKGFAGDLFTIAIWYTLAPNTSESDQVLFQVAGGITISPIGVDMFVGGNIKISSLTDPMPPQNLPNKTILVVVTVSLTQGRIYRRPLNSTVPATQKVFSFPEYWLTNPVAISVPRMSTWPQNSLARIKLSGSILGVRFFNTGSILGDTIFNQGPPDWHPRCPSVKDVAHYALEHSKSLETVELYNVTLPGTATRGKPSPYIVTRKPTFGDMLHDDGSVVSQYPVLLSKLVYIPYGQDFVKNDSLLVQAVSDIDGSCVSASTANVSVLVINVNDPPVGNSTNAIAEPGKGVTILLGGTDPDGDVSSIRGGNARVELSWTSTSLTGRLLLGTCSNATIEITKNSGSYKSSNGTGWPATFCYYPNYTSPKFIRVGLSVIGQDSFTFLLVDDVGAVALMPAYVTIDVLSPVSDAVGTTLYGMEETRLSLTGIAQQPFQVARAWLVSPPSQGTVFVGNPDDPISNVISDLNNTFYLGNTNFAGSDQLSIALEDDLGYVSPTVTIFISLQNTYDASNISVPNPAYLAKLYDRLLLGITIHNVDPDVYQLQILASLEDSTVGLLAIGNLSLTGAVATRGTACIDVGCQEPIQVNGLLSQVAAAVKLLEYVSIAPQDNQITIILSDDHTGNGWTQVQSLSLRVSSAEPNVWGSTSTSRGDRVLGAAIVGSIVAFLLVFGRGVWACLPPQVRAPFYALNTRVRVWTRRKAKHVSWVRNRAKLNPPNHPGTQTSQSSTLDETSKCDVEEGHGVHDQLEKAESVTIPDTRMRHLVRLSLRMEDFILGLDHSTPAQRPTSLPTRLRSGNLDGENVESPSPGTSHTTLELPPPPRPTSLPTSRRSVDRGEIVDSPTTDATLESPPPLPPRPPEYVSPLLLKSHHEKEPVEGPTSLRDSSADSDLSSFDSIRALELV